MSTSVTIRTTKELNPEELFNYLLKKGEQFIITSSEFPCIKFGTYEKAIRGIEVNKEDNGYEVRICYFSSKDDYLLFRRTISYIIELTNGKAYLEDDDDEFIENPIEKFDSKWIDKTMGSSINITRILVNHSGSHITMDGLFFPFCIGAHMFKEFNISLTEDYNQEDAINLMKYLCDIQWALAKSKDTSSRLSMPSPYDSEKTLSISIISIEDDKVSEFDFISVADTFAIVDIDNKTTVFIPFKEIWKILPGELFQKIDELQYKRIGEVTTEEVREMMKYAKKFQPEDLHHQPIFPGKGYDEDQNTFILRWNPAISSIKLDEHNNQIENMLTEYFNWSVWEHEKAKCGDRFFLVKVGEGNTGIVMSGVFTSHPYEANDWSGQRRKTFYMDMEPNVILNPNKAPMITIEQLSKEIPTFNWAKGPSGVLLAKEDAQKLEKMWQQYIIENQDAIDNKHFKVLNLVNII